MKKFVIPKRNSAMNEKINELNQVIDQEKLKIAHFNEKGLSITPLSNNCIFIYCNDYTGNLCFYTRALFLEDEDLANAKVLSALFRLSGPATGFPGYSLGMDNRTNNLWISSHLAIMDARSDVFASKVEEFLSKAKAFQTAIEETLNKAKEESAKAFSAADNFASLQSNASLMNMGSTDENGSDGTSEVGVDSSNRASKDEVDSNELMQLMSSSNLIWG